MINKNIIGISSIKNSYAKKIKSFFIAAYRDIISLVDSFNNKPSFFDKRYDNALSKTDLAAIERNVEQIIRKRILLTSYREVPVYTDNIYKRGKSFATKILIREGMKKDDIPTSFTFRDEDAIRYLKNAAFNNISRASMDLQFGVRNIIIDSIAQGKSIRQTKLEIKNLFQKLPASDKKVWPKWKKLSQSQKLGIRAEFIARHETIKAFDKGTLNRYSEVGIEYVRWEVTAHPCPRCSELEGREFKIDGFGNPEMPLHILCECVWIAIIRSKK